MTYPKQDKAISINQNPSYTEMMYKSIWYNNFVWQFRNRYIPYYPHNSVLGTKDWLFRLLECSPSFTM